MFKNGTKNAKKLGILTDRGKGSKLFYIVPNFFFQIKKNINFEKNVNFVFRSGYKRYLNNWFEPT